jgi:hypothetical protein
MIHVDDLKEAQAFYSEALQLLNESGEEFLLGGAFAIRHHTGIFRNTKDLDIFCRPSQYTRILKFFADKGYKVELTDSRWLSKVFKDDYFIDVIFNSVSNTCTVDDTWFQHAVSASYDDVPVKIMAPEELIWCKLYVQNRERFDGADVNHLLLRCGRNLDWERLFRRMDPHWHLLLAGLLVFQFVYPGEYHDIIPKWLFDELIKRAEEQYAIPASVEKVCLGPLIDNTQYRTDIVEWNYKSMTIKTV